MFYSASKLACNLLFPLHYIMRIFLLIKNPLKTPDWTAVQQPVFRVPQKHSPTDLTRLSSCFHGIWNTWLHLLIPSLFCR